MIRGPGTNTGHGHVWKRPDGMLARCGGPGMCKDCAADQAQMRPEQGAVVTITGTMISLGAKAIHAKRGRHGQFDILPEYLQQQYRDESAACLEAAINGAVGQQPERGK